uniref:Uncharacterized protein n=1 Tax=viral metagenome TaxID=1070528 RepID=A0A6M3K6R6_9ZZZZ
MEEEIKKPEETSQDYIDKVNDLLNLNEIADLVKSNEKIFEVNNISYRIKKPSYKQRQEVYKKKMEKYIDFLKDEKYLLEKDLKILYSKRGIDIDKMNIELENKMRRRDEMMIKLGEAIKNKSGDNDLQILKREIESMNDEIQILAVEKSNLLDPSIEKQVSIFIYSYFTFVLAEKKDGENWLKVWNTYEDYENGEQELINRFSFYTTMMIGNSL